MRRRAETDGLGSVERIRLAFSDHYRGFDPESCALVSSLRRRMTVACVGRDEMPDALVYGDFGESHWSFAGKKVYLTGENMLPDFGQCDLALTPVEIAGEPRAVRYPYYAQVIREPEALLGTMAEEEVAAALARGSFCSFVVSNPRCPERNRAFKALHRLRTVSSGGGLFNNLGHRIADKASFIRAFRFDIAFENSASPGYVTEKLVEPLMAGCIPIYWGAPDVTRDFNPARFVHAREFPSWDALAAHVVRLDGDPEARRRILRQPIFNGDRLPAPLRPETLAGAFGSLLAAERPGVRNYRHRRLREHLREGKTWWQEKMGMLRCKSEAALWRLGWRL